MASRTKTYKGHTLRKVTGGWVDPYGHVFRTLTDAKKFIDRHVLEGARKNPRGSKKLSKASKKVKKAMKPKRRKKSATSTVRRYPGAILSNPARDAMGRFKRATGRRATGQRAAISNPKRDSKGRFVKKSRR